MGKALRYLIFGLAAIAAQGVLGHLGVPDQFIPQLMVIGVVSLSFSEVNSFGCCMTFVLGLLMDFSSAVLVGPWAGALVVVFCGLALLSQRLFIDSGVAAIVITFVSVVVASVMFSVLGPEYPAMTWGYPQKVLGQALVTSLVSPLLLGFLARRVRKNGGAFSGRGAAVPTV